MADIPEVLTLLLPLVGLIGGLACGLLGAATGRLLGTMFNVTPVFVWLVVLASAAHDGLAEPEYRALGAALLGVLVGLSASQLVRRRRRGAPR